jgi:flagellar hook-basal body complex protein FliE
MDVRTSIAAQSYAQARSAAAPEPQPEATESSFARLAENFADTLMQGEETARAAMTGGADPHALVQALASTETAVQTVATVRDKLVEAYQEILRMPV